MSAAVGILPLVAGAAVTFAVVRQVVGACLPSAAWAEMARAGASAVEAAAEAVVRPAGIAPVPGRGQVGAAHGEGRFT